MDIYGNTQKFSMPQSTVVKIFDATTGLYLSQTISDPQGNFVFFNIPVGSYRILAIPPDNSFNALIKFFIVTN